MVHKKKEGTYHHIEKLTKEMPGFLSPGKGLPLLLITEYSGINKDQGIPDRSKTAHRKPPAKCFLTGQHCWNWSIATPRSGICPEMPGSMEEGQPRKCSSVIHKCIKYLTIHLHLPIQAYFFFKLLGIYTDLFRTRNQDNAFAITWSNTPAKRAVA